MKLQYIKSASKNIVSRSFLVLIVLTLAFVAPLQFLNKNVSADKYDDKINALRQDIAAYEAQVNALRAQADTLQNTVNQINLEKMAIQAQIDLNQQKYDQLVANIAETEKKIQDNRDALGETIANLYVDGQISPIEMLASSNNVSDYLDKQEYRNSVRDELLSTIGEIKELKAQLEAQKAEVGKVLDEQKFKRDELASKEAVQQKLLNDTKGDANAYTRMINSTQAQIKEQQAAQQAAYAEARRQWQGGYIVIGSTGGYPWAGAPYPCWNYSCIDPWQLYYRECVSYVAWKLNNEGYGVRGFGGAGNAYEWPNTTRSYTSQSTGVPHEGDAVVIRPGTQGIGWTGHVMFVENVNSDGSINISEYNFAGPGQYSQRRITQSSYANYVFISFPRR